MSFICMRIKNDFHIKGWAPTLVLKERPGGTRKWPSCSQSRTFGFCDGTAWTPSLAASYPDWLMLTLKIQLRKTCENCTNSRKLCYEQCQNNDVYPICETAAGFFGRGEDSKSEKEMYNWVPSAENEIEMKWNWLFYYVIVTFRAKQLLHHGWRRRNRDPFPSHKDCNEGRAYIKQNWMLCWHYDKGLIYCRPTFQ